MSGLAQTTRNIKAFWQKRKRRDFVGARKSDHGRGREHADQKGQPHRHRGKGYGRGNFLLPGYPAAPLPRFFVCGDLEIELVQGIKDFAAVNRFIEKRGEGLYHIAYEVDDLEQDMRYFHSIGVGLRNPEPRPGANHTLVNYIDAEAGHGVISELVQKREQ